MAWNNHIGWKFLSNLNFWLILPNCNYDNIKKIVAKDLHFKKILFDQILSNFQENKKNVLVTLHPDTLKDDNTKKMTDLICKLIKKNKSINFILTYPNFDNGYEYIIKKFKYFRNWTDSG